MKRVALFGGSFDPPHLGHVLAAAWVRAMTDIDALWVLPALRHPYHKALSPWDQRWRLCHAAFAHLGPWISLRDDEQRNHSGFTFDLVQLLRDQYPATRFSLVGGSDTAADLVNWHRGAELATIIDVIAVPRRGQGGDQHPAALPAVSSSQVRARLHAGQSTAELLPAAVGSMITDEKWYRSTP